MEHVRRWREQRELGSVDPHVPGGTDIASITPCVVTYDIHGEEAPNPGDLIAGDPLADLAAQAPSAHNHDNSLQDPASGHDAECGSITIDPDVAIVKTGPGAAVVGQQYTYNLEASNTGIVDAPDVTISDVIPADVDFISATAPCTYDAGSRTVTCDVGTLAPSASTSVQITVVPTVAGQDIVNTAVVTSDDATPGDNASTWTISGPNVSPADVVAPIAPVPVAVAPAFTG